MIRVAFVKFGGLAAGGTERWLQIMAANLPKDRFQVDYYYCDAAPYIGWNYRHAETDLARMRYMEEHQANLIKFRVGAKNVLKPTHDWVDTDFWEKFHPQGYDLVQTAKAGPIEYPYYLLQLPVVEFVSLDQGVDYSPNIVWSIHLSSWQRREWIRAGGRFAQSSVIPVPTECPVSSQSLRSTLNIPDNAVVAGFHQRVDDRIHSSIPLLAFARLQRLDRHFVIMGGSKKYQQQAARLGIRNAHFLEHSGNWEMISQFLNTLDIFAHGRRDGETYGTVLAEAMIHSKPCLSHFSNTGANAQPETMGPGGLFAKDLKDYEEKLELLFSDFTLRTELGTKGYAHSHEHYTVEKCVEELAELYGHLCGRKTVIQRVRKPSYGYSPLGFLYSTDISRNSRLAMHAITGSTPAEFDLFVFCSFLAEIDVAVIAGVDVDWHSLVAASVGRANARIYAFSSDSFALDALRVNIALNNWKEKILAYDMAAFAGIGKTLEHKIGLLRVNADIALLFGTDAWLESIQTSLPILFVTLSDNTESAAPQLGVLTQTGYVFWRFAENNRLIHADLSAAAGQTTYLGLHCHAHAHRMSRTSLLAIKYRRAKFKSRLEQNSSTLAKILREPWRFAMKTLYAFQKPAQ